MHREDFRPALFQGRTSDAASARDGQSGRIVPFFPPVPSEIEGGALTRPRPVGRIALIGTYVPRKCGIATFTSDVVQQFNRYNPQIAVDIHAIDNPSGGPVVYEGVAGTIAQDCEEDYLAAARRINESGADAVWLQHEYGIFGGPDGEMVCDFVDRLAPPLVLTLHTVLSDPSPRQERIMRHLCSRASRVMVMSRHGRDLLVSRYHADPAVIAVIPHGAPDRPFGRGDAFKATMGLSGRKVLMTFGLLGPGKGLERVIEALPAVVERHPEVLYRIVGATHPNLVLSDGESYRDGLIDLARRLGVENHIEWDNRFLDTPELLDQIEACDIYLTPYPGLQQATSGTLSYAVALGKAVVSTPYVHARELLSDDAGVLIEPGSTTAIAEAVNGLLDDPVRLLALQRRAYARGRGTIWPAFARAGAELVASAIAPAPRQVPLGAVPGLTGVFGMSDGTGMLQHGFGVVPDRRHGYCLDDNARALMLMNVAPGLSRADRLSWSMVYASFIQHAWNPEAGRFRNFMAFDRSWCEDVGSDDSNGRGLWALGHTAELSPEPEIARWARRWFDAVYPALGEMDSPRSVAFAMLGAAAILRTDAGHAGARALLERGGALLHALLDGARRPDWGWFEAMLGYDNPRLSQALIEAGIACGRHGWTRAGLETLDWIADRQTASSGHFRAIGSETFGRDHASMPFDQQPLEAQAAVEAARSAFAASEDRRWVTHAGAAHAWFFGANDRGAVLADIATGRCRDGITPRGANENCGAESILAFHLAHHSMLALSRAADPAPDRSGDRLEPGSRSTPGQSAAQPVAHP
jgi:glycosyltransferase involved in cell wall biosynthesis